MKIIAIKSGLFRDRIKVIAEKDESYKSTSGDREWFLKKGQTVTLKVPKSKMFQVGEEVGFEYCVERDTNRDTQWSMQGQIPWSFTESAASQNALNKNKKAFQLSPTAKAIFVLLILLAIGAIINYSNNNNQKIAVVQSNKGQGTDYSPLRDFMKANNIGQTPAPIACTGTNSDLDFISNSYELSDLFAFNNQGDAYGIIKNNSTTCAATDIVMAVQLVDSSKTVLEEQDLTLSADNGNGLNFLNSLAIEPQQTAGYKNTFQVYQALAQHDEYGGGGSLKPGIKLQTHLVSVQWTNQSYTPAQFASMGGQINQSGNQDPAVSAYQNFAKSISPSMVKTLPPSQPPAPQQSQQPSGFQQGMGALKSFISKIFDWFKHAF